MCIRDRLNHVLHVWKQEYSRWMHPQQLERSWSLSDQQWHQLLRKAFRTLLFQLVGCYEMSICFLVAPFNARNLEIFRDCWERNPENAEAMEDCKRILRQHPTSASAATA